MLMMLRRVVLVLFIFFIFAPSLRLSIFAQEENTSSTRDEPQEAALQQSIQPEPTEKNITAIEVRGNKSISTNTIISKIKSRIGGIFKENIISDDIKRLVGLKYFSDVKIDTEEYQGGIKIIITVSERPIIEKMSFVGFRQLRMKEDKLKEQLRSKEGQYLDYPDLAEDIHTIEKLYEKKGFGNVKVDYDINLDQTTNKAKVEFRVSEGRRLRIKEIIVKGNNAFPAKRILKLMKTKKAWLFNAGVLNEEVLQEDIKRVKDFYQGQGYADVAIDFTVKSDELRPFLYIYLEIKEGEKYIVGDVSIEGNQELPEKTILANLKEILPGKVFSEEALKRDIANIQGLYFDRGYISCQVQKSTSLNPSTQRVDVHYRIIENDVAYVDKIKIRGNVKTRDLVIRRELRIKPGDRFDGSKLRRSSERLQNLGFFEEINYDTEDTPVPNKKDLIVEVKEAKTGTFSIGGGYSSVDRFVGFVEIEQKNFDWRNFPYFTGAGQNLKFRASTGSVAKGFDLSFTEPWLFDYPISFGFDAYRRQHERETDVGYGYDQTVTGGDLRLGKELSEYIRIDGTYRYDVVRITDVSSEATSDLQREVGTNSISSTELAVTFDSRDNVFDPHRGNLLISSVEVAGGPFGADKDFWKTYNKAAHFIPLFVNSTLELRARAGVVKAYGDSQRVPLYERFYAGGADTIRGYDERRVGPIDPVTKDPLGGEAMLIGNVEYIYPLLSFLKLAAFYDVGNVWAEAGKLGSGDFKSGVGFGLRIKTPLGPFVLDYGIPLDIEPGETDKKSGRVHFSMSHGF